MITQERLKECLDYDPETGVFAWMHRTSNRIKIGDVAGSLDRKGYLYIRIDRKLYALHRLAWLHVHGEVPNVIDHIDGNPLNNAISNLRNVNQRVNTQNIRKATKNNKSTGLLGASFDRFTGRFKSEIRINGKIKNLGRFDTAEQAHNAYLSAKRKYHAGCVI